MKLDLVTVAEGAAADSRGAVTLVAANQRVVGVSKFPGLFRTTVFVTLTDEGTEPAGPSSVMIQVQDAKGQALFTVTQPVDVPPKQWTDLPQLLNMAVDVLFAVSEASVYTVGVSLSPGDERVERKLYLVDAAVAAQPASAEPRTAFG